MTELKKLRNEKGVFFFFLFSFLPPMHVDAKIHAAGDGAVGKTSMLIRYTTNKPLQEAVPTVFDNYEADILVEGTSVKMSLWDGCGFEGYSEKYRNMSWLKTDTFLLCVSVVCPRSLESAKTKWLPEIRQTCPNTNVLLVGTKSDLRGHSELEIPPEKLQEVVKNHVEVKNYVECSAMTGEGIKHVFDTALLMALGLDWSPPKSRCVFC
jgi:small GTP-binding protein